MNQMQQTLYFGNTVLDRNRPRKMAFYGRVSTQHEEQIEALENQMQWYDDQAKYHPNWTVVDRYIDEGITGTLAKKRPAFIQMIEDAKRQKFDLIVTREVCRFARNTVDTLVITRELKNYGIEVYFVEDNIWTMDGDGELRLTIMATLAQEESRKISERVRAGQMISRENGVLYGNGNIIGYDRVGDTYVINPEQAETVRLVFELYSQGYGQTGVMNELTKRGCKDGNGKVKWSCVKISRILRNATYMGYICYNKSKVNNFLEKKRIKNLDESSIVLVKGTFEPIVSEELWHYCEQIRKNRITEYHMADGETRRNGTASPQHLWVKKLRCRCGAGYSRYTWRVLKGTKTPVYGYQCNYRTQNPAKSFVERHNLIDQKSCDAICIPEWKLDLMAKYIFTQIWGDQRDAVLRACAMIDSCAMTTVAQYVGSRDTLELQLEKAKKRLYSFAEMRADGELSKEEYLALSKKTEAEIQKVRVQMQNLEQEEQVAASPYDMAKIKKALGQVVDISGPKIQNDLIEEFVETVTPVENYVYRWKLNLGCKDTDKKPIDLMHPESNPVLTFTINFEQAKQFRNNNHMPTQFRKCAWSDLQVEVYL